MILDITRETCFPTLLFWLSSWIKCSVKKIYYDQPQIQCTWRCRLADVWDVLLCFLECGVAYLRLDLAVVVVFFVAFMFVF